MSLLNKLQALYGLKWNPFARDIPLEGIYRTPRIKHFCWRVEQVVSEGGFVLVSGLPGSGKSVALRVMDHHLSGLRDVVVGELTRPQATVNNMYRELAYLFGVHVTTGNLFSGAKCLREKWQEHIDTSLFRPVLVIDEAQEMKPETISELRLLSSARFDSRSLLTVVFAGDDRLIEKLRRLDLLPLGSRIRVRTVMDFAPPAELHDCLTHVLEQAGNPGLMTEELTKTVTEHAAGNYRTMMTISNDLLLAAVAKDAPVLDEKLYLEVFDAPRRPAKQPPSSSRRRRA